jgi:hypothetical protein
VILEYPRLANGLAIPYIDFVRGTVCGKDNERDMAVETLRYCGVIIQKGTS